MDPQGFPPPPKKKDTEFKIEREIKHASNIVVLLATLVNEQHGVSLVCIDFPKLEMHLHKCKYIINYR